MIGAEDDVMTDVPSQRDTFLERHHQPAADVDHRIITGLDRVLVGLLAAEGAAGRAGDERGDGRGREQVGVEAAARVADVDLVADGDVVGVRADASGPDRPLARRGAQRDRQAVRPEGAAPERRSDRARLHRAGEVDWPGDDATSGWSWAHPGRRLEQGDAVEIVTLVGGGSSEAQPADKSLVVGKFRFSSRLITGTGKYANYQLMHDCLAASGCEVATTLRASTGMRCDVYGKSQLNAAIVHLAPEAAMLASAPEASTWIAT